MIAPAANEAALTNLCLCCLHMPLCAFYVLPAQALWLLPMVMPSIMSSKVPSTSQRPVACRRADQFKEEGSDATLAVEMPSELRSAQERLLHRQPGPERTPMDVITEPLPLAGE